MSKVVLQSRQFSSYSPADTPRTKVVLQTRQFSASSSTDAVPATKSAHGGSQSAAPATKSAPVPSRRQTTPGRTSDPLASSKVLRLPRNLRRCPANARRRQGVHPPFWQAAKRCACHEICTGAQPTPDDARRCQGDPLASSKALPLPRNLRRCPADARRRQGVHPTPWQAAKCCACHEICAGAQPGRTSDPLASSKVLRLPRNLRRCPADARRRQGVHPTPWQAAKCCACHEICAGAQPTPDDARAYIRPLGKQQSAAPATKSAPVPSRRQTTPGRTSDPLASSKRRTQHANATGSVPVPSRRQTTPGRTSDPLASSGRVGDVM